MSSQTKAIKNIQHAEIAIAGIGRCIAYAVCGLFKVAAMYFAWREKQCHDMIADIHEAVRYSESQGKRSKTTKEATAKRIAKLQGDAVRFANRQKAMLLWV